MRLRRKGVIIIKSRIGKRGIAMRVHEVLTRLRKERGLKQSQVAEYLSARGIDASQRSVSNWETGRTQPNADAFIELCVLYDVRDVQAEFAGKPSALSGLNAVGRRRVDEYTRLLSLDSQFTAVKQAPAAVVRTIPLYDLPVSAGTGQFLDSSSYELMEVGEEVPIEATFAVRISGDSMCPKFQNGETVYVSQRQTLENGEIGIFLLNGSGYCKVLQREKGSTKLVSLNSAYSPVEVSEFDDLRVVGKVIS